MFSRKLKERILQLTYEVRHNRNESADWSSYNALKEKVDLLEYKLNNPFKFIKGKIGGLTVVGMDVKNRTDKIEGFDGVKIITVGYEKTYTCVNQENNIVTLTEEQLSKHVSTDK